GHHPAPRALRGAEAAVVKRQHGVAAGGQRPGEPGRVDDLLPLIPRARDHHRVPHLPGAAIAGQVQVGIQAQPGGEKRHRPGDHPPPPARAPGPRRAPGRGRPGAPPAGPAGPARGPPAPPTTGPRPPSPPPPPPPATGPAGTSAPTHSPPPPPAPGNPAPAP